MRRRINILLTEATVKSIDRLSRPGQRSSFIERAVQHYLTAASHESLQERLKRAALRDRDLDVEIADDWRDVDQEQWQNTRSKRIAQDGDWPRRGEIYLTAVDPTVGHEIRKMRPALIIQNDVTNRYSLMTMVAPITSTVRLPLSPLHVLLPADKATGLAVTSVAVFNQIRAVDRRRLIRKLGTIAAQTLLQVDDAIHPAFGLRYSDSSAADEDE